jgi:DNA invertase Pin-like site-specific DNA recombinase
LTRFGALEIIRPVKEMTPTLEPAPMPRKPATVKPAARPIGVYIRVSSTDQRHDSQREVIEKWLTGNGIDIDAVEWFVDTESGRKMSRPDFDRLQAAIFAGTIRTVVVFKVDRLARRLRDGLNLLCDWSERGVRFVSVTQQIDVSGTMGKMVAALLLGLAELEWEYRKERQAAGIVIAKRSGVYTGRKAGTTKAKPERARELRNRGLTGPEIATALGCSLRTVFRYLDGPKEDTP